MTKTLLAFGFYDAQSPHFSTVRDAFAADGWTIVCANSQAKGAVKKFFDFLRLWKNKPAGVEAVLVPFPGHHIVPLVWLLTRFPRRPMYFEAFISLYDTKVHDRRMTKAGTPSAWALWFTDWLSCRLADEVIIDTQAHKRYFCEEFGIPEKKIRVVYLEARHDLVSRTPHTPSSAFDVFFYGTYIPLQGIEFILDAAADIAVRDPSIHFTLVGGGQTKEEMMKKAKELGLTNVSFEPFLPMRDLMTRLGCADVSLGIFGTTAKAARVIPHKVVDAVAADIPVITRDSPAIRERFADHPRVTLCEPGNGRAIADALIRLRAQIR